MEGKSYFILILFYLLNYPIQAQEIEKYLFLGHTYDYARNLTKVDKRIEEADLSSYKGIWLGGDIVSGGMINRNTPEYLDSLFDLGNPHTHYVLGNHDARNQNLDFYYNVTERPDYYSHHHRGITYMILNTNLSTTDCHSLNDQYDILQNILDTIASSSHLLIMMHHQIFSDDSRIQGFKTNGGLPHYKLNCYDSRSTFWRSLYPELVKVQNRGVEVILLMGDTGWHKGIGVKSTDGVTFLASGINNSYYQVPQNRSKRPPGPDRLLEFQHYPKKRVLTWKFIDLDEMTKKHHTR